MKLPFKNWTQLKACLTTGLSQKSMVGNTALLGFKPGGKLSSREVYFISERGVKQLIGPALVLFSNLVSIKTCFEHQVKLE